MVRVRGRTRHGDVSLTVSGDQDVLVEALQGGRKELEGWHMLVHGVVLPGACRNSPLARAIISPLEPLSPTSSISASSLPGIHGRMDSTHLATGWLLLGEDLITDKSELEGSLMGGGLGRPTCCRVAGYAALACLVICEDKFKRQLLEIRHGGSQSPGRWAEGRVCEVCAGSGWIVVVSSSWMWQSDIRNLGSMERLEECRLEYRARKYRVGDRDG